MLEHGCDAGMSIVVLHDMIRLAERRCTVSSLRVLESVCGSQMMLAYSKMGRTSVV